MTPNSRFSLATVLAATTALPLAAAQAAGHSDVDLGAVPDGAYRNDPMHSYLTFSYDHLGLSNPVLAFDDFTIDLDLDTEEPTSSTVNVTIDPDSVVAGSETWHGHITGADFFDVANHPEITFASTSVSDGGDGAYKVDGDLTIKGETKPVTLNVTINAAMNHPMSGDPVVGVAASGELMRSEFGLGKYVPNIGDAVELNITAEMLKTGD